MGCSRRTSNRVFHLGFPRDEPDKFCVCPLLNHFTRRGTLAIPSVRLSSVAKKLFSLLMTKPFTIRHQWNVQPLPNDLWVHGQVQSHPQFVKVTWRAPLPEAIPDCLPGRTWELWEYDVVEFFFVRRRVTTSNLNSQLMDIFSGCTCRAIEHRLEVTWRLYPFPIGF